MIDNTSHAGDVASELGLNGNPYGSEVGVAAGVAETAYASDVADAVNAGTGYTLRVCQYNIGHFNMGMDAGNICLIGSSNQKAQDYPQFFDYATQLQAWQTRLAAIGADLYGCPEWNNNFGYENNVLRSVQDTHLFDGYNLSVGTDSASAWWKNTLVSKYVMSNAQDVFLGSLNGTSEAYVREAHVTIEGIDVLIAVTHLNYNKTSTHRNSRVNVEIPALVNRYKDMEYVILCGDFNSEGVWGGANSPDNKTGLEEFQPFLTAGFTIANSMARPLLTFAATGSRPDRPSDQNYLYRYLDNIIVKGFAMKNVHVVNDGQITDHCAVWCDLTMIEEGGES